MADLTSDLLRTALAAYRDELLPRLPSDRRYVGAMVANAMDIARRRVAHDDPDKALLTYIYGDRPADLAKLARDIRAGQVNETSHGALAGALLHYLQAELAITNPRFLERSGG